MRRVLLRFWGVAFVLSPLAVGAASGAANAATIPIPQLRPVAGTAATPAPALPEPVVPVSEAVAAKVGAWLEATGSRTDVPAARIAAVLADAPDWPAQSLMRTRFEQALIREAPPAAAVVAAFGGRTPVTADGVLLLAQALASIGRADDAARLVRASWRERDLTEGVEQAILRQFGAVLSADDHAARVEHFLYEEYTASAQRNAKLLDAPRRALVDARIAVIRGTATAGKLLDAVVPALRTEPGYIFARSQYLRRAGKFGEAASLIMTAPTNPAVLTDPDAWSEERRELARRFIDIGDPRTAYQVLAPARARGQTARVEAEFEAGWYALVFLHDPALSRPHFQAIVDNSSTPISRARGAYWLARAAEADGDAAGATAHYEVSAQYPVAFYGQLAAARLARTGLDASEAPMPSDATVTARFAGRELVQALAELQRLGRADDAGVFYRELGATLTDPTEIAMLTDLAEKQGRYALAVQVGKAAQQRGMQIGTLAFPTTALPAYAGKVPPAVVYAIARQESEFAQSVVSSAGAVGVLQVMPPFAAEMAKRGGIPYSPSRIRSDASYNMQIGASELNYLTAMYDGSYVMAFAAYNAGPGRVAQWTKAFGDPRDPSVDVIDWIERIPFNETRNYVQRTIENLGIYRALFGETALRIETDLRGDRAPGNAKIISVTEAAPSPPAAPAAAPGPVTATVATAAKPSPRPAFAAAGVSDSDLAAKVAAAAAANPARIAYRPAEEE